MGAEATCTVRLGGRTVEGKARLETDVLQFRGGEVRLSIPFKQMSNVTGGDGLLSVTFAEGTARFGLGVAAEKWAHKILHPKSRMEKLGVKAGARVSLLGEFEDEFLKDLKALKLTIQNGKISDDAEWIFFAADSKKKLSELTKIAKKIRGAAALWVVYPKGQKEITEKDILSGGRKVGLKDVKVVGFSATHTALKFVLPLSKR